MSLFKELKNLYRSDRFQHEDFHTEIVAQVLRNSPELTLGWLRSLTITDLTKADHITITTQHKFEKLPEHLTDSRPDMAIRLAEGEKREFILIESKVGSRQGETQLNRYVQILAAEKKTEELKKASLVFITLNYEADTVDRTAYPCVNIRVTRWFEFYNKLKAHLEKNSDGLAKELKLFMEENRMSLGNQFRSTDLVAMENFVSARALMDETLDGEVSDEAREILGGVRNRPRDLEQQLRDLKRYTIFTMFDQNNFDCVIGYWFPNESPDAPVWVGIYLSYSPDASMRPELTEAFREWITVPGSSWSLKPGDRGWISMHKGQPIPALMGGKDHVRAIKDHLLALLNEVGEFKKRYPRLGWGNAAPEV
jgi:hypothetical protein